NRSPWLVPRGAIRIVGGRNRNGVVGGTGKAIIRGSRRAQDPNHGFVEMIPYRIPGGHVGERLEIAHVPVGLYPEVLLPGCYRASRVGSNLVGIEITE